MSQSQLEGRDVTYARLRQDTFVPGYGMLKATLQTGTAGTDVSTMSIQGDCLVIKIDKKGKVKTEFGIPLTEVHIFVLGKSEPTALASTKSA